MKPLPLVYPYALIFWIVYGLCYFQETMMLRRRKPKRSESRRQDRGSYPLIMVGLWSCASIAFAGAVNVPSAGFPAGQVVCYWAGVILIAAGALLRWHYFKMLGEIFDRWSG
jgi:hypothetical protein